MIALLGLLVSGYLYFAYVSGGPIVCGANRSCEVIRASVYANFFGLPTPAYGLIFYGLLGVGAALWSGERNRRMYWLLVLLTGGGLVVTAYLTYLEAFVIHAWCRWCVVSALLSVSAFVVVLLSGKCKAPSETSEPEM